MKAVCNSNFICHEIIEIWQNKFPYFKKCDIPFKFQYQSELEKDYETIYYKKYNVVYAHIEMGLSD